MSSIRQSFQTNTCTREFQVQPLLCCQQKHGIIHHPYAVAIVQRGACYYWTRAAEKTFVDKTLTNSHKTSKFAKFSPSKVSAIQYHMTAPQLLCTWNINYHSCIKNYSVTELSQNYLLAIIQYHMTLTSNSSSSRCWGGLLLSVTTLYGGFSSTLDAPCCGGLRGLYGERGDGSLSVVNPGWLVVADGTILVLVVWGGWLCRLCRRRAGGTGGLIRPIRRQQKTSQ